MKLAILQLLFVFLSVQLFFTLPVFTPQAFAQQATVGRVAVVNVNDQSFPLVSAYLDVADANGAAVAGLAAANFAVLENGQPSTIQSVIPDASQPLALLFALDRSTDATTWAAVQGAAASVINTLGADDQVAITTIFEQVQPVTEFTANKEAALSALAGIAAGGQFSAINPAFVDAINRFNNELPARRAIILVADAPDNISGVPTADVIAQVSGRGVPIFVVGYGGNVQNEASFTEVATATGGRFFAVNSANDLQATLTSLLPQLRQGYRVDFISTAQADSLPHTAQIQVVAPNVTGVADVQFVARPSTLEVTLPGLTNGQPLAGVVNLTAAASISGTVANVEFRVDDVVIGSAPNLATPVVWDTSTLTPGPHQLTVIVTDNVGNQGEATVDILIPESSPRLDLLGIEDERFPSLSAFVDAFGNNGLPLSGLNAQSFVLTENNQPVDPARVTVAVDATQPLNLVLVLDRSLPVGDWAQIRNTANSLVDALRPQDQMAIYSFAAMPTLVQGVTGDKNTLKGALATVEAVPPPVDGTQPVADNGLYQALLDGLNFAETLPEGRRAVIVLTNGIDNTGQIALSALTSALESQTVPVHVLAFGVDGQSAGTLAAIAQLAGGNSIAVNGAADVRSALQTLTLLLQQGYRIDFTSALQADNNRQTLTVALAANGLNAETTGEFIALSRPITVTFPNVVDGATVAGAMNLTAQADTPAPIASVVYRLNGDVLAEVADTTFSIVWNSDTVAPGDYTVEAVVTDAVGNQGTASVSFVVVAPVTVAAALAPGNSDGDVVVGDEVMINADVEVFSGQARVDFYVNGQLIGSDAQPPFSVRFDSSEFGAGSHEVTVVARDDTGREATSSFPLTLVAPLEPTPEATETAGSGVPGIGSLPSVSMPDMNFGINWGVIFSIVGMIVTAAVALGAVMAAMRSARRNANEQKMVPMRVTLSNLGNVATGYLLRGDDPAGILGFRFSLNGVILGLPPVARLTEDVPQAQASAGRRASFGGVQLPNMPNMPSMPQGTNPAGGSTIGEMADKLNEVSMVGRIIADILTSIAMFLPSTLARPIRQVASQIRRGQMLASRVKYMRRQVDRLNKSEMGQKVVQGTADAAGQVGQAATSEATREAVAHGLGRAGEVVSSTAQRQVNSMYDLTGQDEGATGQLTNGQVAHGNVAVTGAAAGAIAAAGSRQWVYLPPLNPGETVTIDVLVGASGRNATGQHQSFRILSRALGEENAQPVVEEGSIRLAQSSPWPSLMRFILAGVVVLVALAIIFLLARNFF